MHTESILGEIKQLKKIIIIIFWFVSFSLIINYVSHQQLLPTSQKFISEGVAGVEKNLQSIYRVFTVVKTENE